MTWDTTAVMQNAVSLFKKKVSIHVPCRVCEELI
jgi:hypothetical protein